MENKKLTTELQDHLNKVTKEYYSTIDQVEDPSDIELYDELKFDGFDGWLQDSDAEQKLNPDFAIFGERGCGSKVAVWLLKDRDLNSAPIVLISSEGELGVIASDYFTFMTVIGLGYDMFQFINDEDLSSPWNSKNTSFLEWLKSTYKVEPPKNLTQWLEKTKSDNPNLEQTIELAK